MRWLLQDAWRAENCSSALVSLGALKFVGGCARAALSGGATAV